MKIIKKTLATLCVLCLTLPAFAAEESAERCFKNKKGETEETVLDENVLPRRGNGLNSYEQRNPRKEEQSAPTKENSENRPESKKSSSEEKPRKKDVSVSADRNTAYNWYCPHRKDGKAPEIPSEMSFVENHGGYYLDRNVKDDDKVVYLTFDAGYENGNVEKILDVLKAEEVPGAFFILENLITSKPELVKRMVAEGHTVCNHTAKHRDMSKATDKETFAAELNRLEQIYRDTVGGEIAKYYRPPEGRFSEQNLIHAEEMGYRTIFWSFAYADWDNEKQPSREQAMEKILTGTHNGEVLLLHPTSATNAEILPELIREWKKMGYRFGTLDELVSHT